MDWGLVIERNGQALARILASLVTMAALSGGAPTLPRRLHRAVLRLLRPAESAARRLIVVMAREIVVTLPPSRPRKAKSRPTILRGGFGTGIILPRGVSVRGEGKRARPPAMPLLDPLRRRSRPARLSPTDVPRISVPGVSRISPVIPRRPPSPDDAIDATRLAWRLEALAAALDDLPAQARRFAPWQARRDRALRARRPHRISPLRPGRAYGLRRPCSRRRPHEVDEVLRDLHYFAHCALHGLDTS